MTAILLILGILWLICGTVLTVGAAWADKNSNKKEK
jgi:hypothetical protein